MRRYVLVCFCLFSVACHRKPPVSQPPPPPVIQTITVDVPVPVKVMPPAELLKPVVPPLPVFISPDDPLATSALTADGERLLRGMIEDLLQRLAAWKAWATAP